MDTVSFPHNPLCQESIFNVTAVYNHRTSVRVRRQAHRYMARTVYVPTSQGKDIHVYTTSQLYESTNTHVQVH